MGVAPHDGLARGEVVVLAVAVFARVGDYNFCHREVVVLGGGLSIYCV